MVKHIVMWTLKEYAEGASKRENLLKMKEGLLGLKEKIPFVEEMEVGVDFNQTKDAADLVLYSRFKDREALKAYSDHPAHVNLVRSLIRKVRDEKRVVDFEVLDQD